MAFILYISTDHFVFDTVGLAVLQPVKSSPK